MFTLTKDNKIDIEPRLLFIPEFKRIWNNDSTKTKHKAKLLFAYIYFMSDYKSEYNLYGIEKHNMICKEVMKNESFEPDDLVLSAMKKYESLQETTSMRYLKSIRETVNSLILYYDKLKFSGDLKDLANFKPDNVTKAMKDIESTLEALEKWENKVREEEDNMQIRGGGKLSTFEDAEKATWLKTQIS